MLYPTLAADWHFLVNPISPLVAFGTLLFWGWICSSHLDKDAMYYHFPRVRWNTAHMITGLLGFCLMLAPIPVAEPIPWLFAVTFPGGLLLMLSSILVYWYYRNQRVPEEKKFYLSTDKLRDWTQQRRASKAAAAAAVTLIDSEGVARIPPGKESETFPVHIAMEEFLTPAILARATRLELTPAKNGQFAVAQYVDTIRYRRDGLEGSNANAIINYLKSHAGLDAQDMRRKQMGDMKVEFASEQHGMRIRTAGSSHGQTLAIDFDLQKQVNIKPTNLGFLSKQLESLDEVLDVQRGIVLVTAPKSGGRTTTLYGLLRRHDAFTNNIRTLELETLIQIDGVGHNQFKPSDDGPDFSTQLRSMLRRDPNIVMVSDVVDAQTAKEAAHPGVDGPLIYVGLRASSGLEGLAGWCKAVGNLPLAAVAMRAVISELLLRRLCENCRVPYSPAPEQLKKLGLPVDQVKQLFKPSGKIIERNKEETCPVCAGLGYRGLVGCYEVMIFDDEARKFIAKGDLNGLRSHVARGKLITLQQAALRKAIEGITSIDEVIRVTRGSQKPQKKPAGEPLRKEPAAST